MNKIVGAFLITAGAILIYSFLCRSLGIYFFWESSFLGWSVLFVGLMLLSINLIRRKKAKGKKPMLERIFIGVLIFILFIQFIDNLVIHNSDAYSEVKSYLIKNDSLKRDIGEINGFGFTSSGSISTSWSAAGKEGYAQISLIVKGDKKYKDIIVYTIEEINQPWKIIYIQ